jgi:phosphatidylglycerol:prolipoprotein diacylglycerol transferase
MIVFPEFDPVAIALGPVKIRWYGLTYVAAFVFALLLARRRARRADAPIGPGEVEDMIFYGALGVVLGGRIGYLLFYGWGEVLNDWRYIYRVWEGGMSFHGGLLGVMLALWWFGRRRGRTFFEMTDFVAPVVPLGLFCGRIGNFINGELWGKPTDVPWGFLYNGVVRHPSMLYQAALEGLALFALLWWFSSVPRPRMAVSGAFLLGYGLFRGIVEFVRVPDPQYGYLAFGWLTMGQVLSLPMIVAGAALIWIAYRRGRQPQAA